MPEWFSAVWPVATFFLGAASAYLRDFLTEKRQLARELQARQADREKATLDRREAFELDHLQRLNEALHTLGRAVGRAHHIDLMASRESGQYASTRLTDEANDALGEANRDVAMLKKLVLDEDLRELVSAAHEALNMPSAMHRSDPEDAEAAFARAVLLTERTQSALAERIRQIYLTAELPERRAS